MIYKYQFQNETEKQNIIKTNKNKILIEEDNITEGNFLIFSDTKPIEMQLKELKETVDILTLKTEGVI